MEAGFRRDYLVELSVIVGEKPVRLGLDYSGENGNVVDMTD